MPELYSSIKITAKALKKEPLFLFRFKRSTIPQ
jgi:hypothetical protein